MRLLGVGLLLPVLALAGCGSEVGRAGSPPGGYDGPLFVTRADAERPAAGAAGDVVECDTWGAGGFSDQEVYGEGATAGTAEQALLVAESERLFDGPSEGLTVAEDEGDRVLFTLEVDGEVKQAVIVRDGPATEGAGGDGWYVESWARCDFAELPRSSTDSLGLQIWSDAAGVPVPTTRVSSWRGPQHCDWQAMTFLQVGDESYVGNLLPELAEYVAGTFHRHVAVPDDARATGYQRDGRRLWLAADRSYAYVGSRADAEAWPRSDGLACD